MKFKNIVLIGLTGCGKTTIGRLLAEKLKLAFFDIDKCIEDKEGKCIRDIFIYGEEYFRIIESEVLKEVAGIQQDKVIATGGGAVKIEKNMKIFDENSVIIFINRAVELIAENIDISTRPLLAEDKGKIFTLYKERYPLYKKYCHYEVMNNSRIEDALNEIINILR